MLSPAEALETLKGLKTVAIIGLSPKTDRPSFHVGHFLQGKGFDIIPVTPKGGEILGQKSLLSLAEIEEGGVDVLDFFVNGAKLPAFTKEVLRIKPKLVWCQITVVNDEFFAAMEEAGIPFVADVCPKIEWDK